MKNFLKYVLATVVGIMITSLILFVIFAGIVNIIVSSQEKTVNVEPNTILYLKLDQTIVDRKPNMPFDFRSFGKNQTMGLNNILENIKKAKEDNNIAGIHLDLAYIPAGIGTIEEIRNALLDFRQSGKFVTAYSETFTQGAYYLSTAADRIFFNPEGFFNFVGLRAQGVFFKNTLKKLDIEPTIIRCGAYKSAPEQLTEEKFSDANREQLSKLITSIWDDVCRKISAQRSISVRRLNEIADKLLLKDAQAAYELGFVDSLVYRDQLLSILKQKTGIGETKDLHTITLGQYSRVPKERPYKGLAKDKIAIVYASGEINSGDGNDNNIGSDKFGKAIRDARRDSSIKAIVVRVNSPGGSAIASEVIWRELQLARKSKPVVISMGDLAASGGYYISCMADSILAQPNTITGSIGVFGVFINTEGLFNKLGITFDTEKTNKYSDFMSVVRPLQPAEMDYYTCFINGIYKTFVGHVSEGRHLAFETVDKIGQGRIWSGIDALELRLIDKIGGLNDAVKVAKNMAGLSEKYRIIELPEQEDPIQKLIKDLTDGAKIKALSNEFKMGGEYVKSIMNILENQGVLTRMPFDISVY
jgi:protease-4